jgi:catechol 2,3-dioxygenase-like lactoylglutathione lyase family enzyme
MAFKIEGLAPMLSVFDMPRSIAFYRDVLGFELALTSRPREGDDFDWGLLRHGGMELMLNTAYDKGARPPAPDSERTRIHEDAALFFACRDLDALYEHLRAHGIAAKPPTVAYYGMKQVWLSDPDGYTICFQWRADEAH